VGLAVALAIPLAVAPTQATPATRASALSAPTSTSGPAAPGEAGVDAQAEIAAAAAVADAVPGGPRPTSIRPSEDDASTTVLVHGLGSAATAQARENRSYRHSDLQPTARFASSGDVLTITVPEGAPALSVSIGLRGVHGEQNGGVERGRWTAPLTEGVNSVTSPLDGMVHLVSTIEGGSADVVVEGGQAVPHFVAGQTTNEHLRAEMARLTGAPFVQVIGDRFFGDFQTRYTGSVIRVADMQARVAELDRAIEITNHAYGLRDDGTGLARKAPHRVYVAAPDTSGGYANAGAERVTFPVSSGAAGDLFRAPSWDQWGWWHEIGHTYQTPTVNWGGQGEVFVNMSALHVQTAMGWAPRLDQQTRGFDAFFDRPVDERSYMAEGNVFVRLFLYDQLRRAFGDDFWPRLNQELRVLEMRGEVRHVDDSSRQQLFAVTAARVADRDLREYFRQWGVTLDDASRAALAELPPLEQPIWQNRLSTAPVVEHLLSPYSVPVGVVTPPDERVVVGQRQLTAPLVPQELADSDGTGDVTVHDQVLSALEPGVGTAGVTVENDMGVREVLTASVEVTPGSSFRLLGLGDEHVATLAVPRGADEVRLLPGTGDESHPYFADEYVGGAVTDAQGRQTASFSVLGTQNAYPAAAAFDGTPITEGMYLTVRHREASRLARWDDDVEAPADAAKTQHYRLDGGRLVPVASLPAPSALDAVPAPEAVELRRGRTTPVPVTVEAAQHVAGLALTVTATAPTGTLVDIDEEALVTQVRLPGGDWVTDERLPLTHLTLDEDGRTVTATVSCPDGLDLPVGTQLRWIVGVAVPVGAGTVGGGLDWIVTGTADGGTVTARR
jgi:hypothetical protein